ncbi:MAG: inositol monophosphatase family protein [Ilumatobacteraceae bacterium]
MNKRGDPVDAVLDDLLSLACAVAVEAGDLALAARHGEELTGADASTKSTATDLVTVHDRAAERVVVEGILAARPNDAIVGEEGTDRRGTSGVSWYVDPIDGTTNFVYDLPAWVTSVAAGDESGMLVGAVYVPPMGELFAAARGCGATLDGAPIRCSEQTNVALALVATGFSYDPARRRRQAGVVEHLIASVRDIRRGGSAALDLCSVAAGRVDAYFEQGLNRWDMAAGELIAREAGCRTGDHRGGPVATDDLLVAAPGIFDGMASLLTAARLATD